jgi:hypothetical protein
MALFSVINGSREADVYTKNSLTLSVAAFTSLMMIKLTCREPRLEQPKFDSRRRYQAPARQTRAK